MSALDHSLISNTTTGNNHTTTTTDNDGNDDGDYQSDDAVDVDVKTAASNHDVNATRGDKAPLTNKNTKTKGTKKKVKGKG